MRALILHASDPGFLTLPCDVRPLTVPIGLFSVETGFAQLSFWLTGSTRIVLNNAKSAVPTPLLCSLQRTAERRSSPTTGPLPWEKSSQKEY